MRIEPTGYFLRQLKKLSKKYPSMSADMRAFSTSLLLNPEQGTGIRRGAHKVRMPITSKGQGKSGGARIITYIRIDRDTIYLLDIYDKSEREDIDDKDLDDFVDFVDKLRP